MTALLTGSAHGNHQRASQGPAVLNNNYTIWRKDRKGKGGEVMIMARRELVHGEISNMWRRKGGIVSVNLENRNRDPKGVSGLRCTKCDVFWCPKNKQVCFVENHKKSILRLLGLIFPSVNIVHYAFSLLFVKNGWEPCGSVSNSCIDKPQSIYVAHVFN